MYIDVYIKYHSAKHQDGCQDSEAVRNHASVQFHYMAQNGLMVHGVHCQFDPSIGFRSILLGFEIAQSLES